ncbi:uncharacterized protein G2W53_012679 [Senna tora]|uniref:Uncharacterized protein n=1 Tax=Senna tora TaxID=362788 RepID=A0A834WRX5_9FABA|nr:uncharacterized protein G2W53_012679 [Senna tora]
MGSYVVAIGIPLRKLKKKVAGANLQLRLRNSFQLVKVLQEDHFKIFTEAIEKVPSRGAKTM